MKRTFFILVAFFAIITLSSCHTQRFVVHGQPETTIETLDGSQTLAVIDENGTAKVKLDIREGYDPFLQAVLPGSNQKVPFALDYKNAHRNNWLMTGAIFGLVPTIGLGSIYMLTCFGDYRYLKVQNTNNDLIKTTAQHSSTR